MTVNNSSTAVTQTEAVNMEAYSVVFSVAVLILAMLLGGGGSLSILLALFRSRGVRTYTLLLVFFFLCCGVDLVWSPMELVHLLFYHYTLRNPTEDFGVATFAVYIFLCAGMGVLITALCVENVLRFSRHFRTCRFWPVVVCMATFFISVLMTLAFLYTSLNDLREETSVYFLLDSHSSVARVSLLSIVIILVVVAVVVMIVAEMVMGRREEMKTSDSYLSAGYNNETHAQLPHFLMKQTGAAASCEDVDKDSASAASLNRLPDAAEMDVLPAMSFKGRNSPRGGDLGDPGLRGSPMLGVNMAQVLGRRRHTICQIGDSGPSPDPIPKPKQYNYVRKFSVDISALQAQLSNPKLFKDKTPFQSDQDLTQRERNTSNRPDTTRPLLPLTDLDSNASKFPKGTQPSLKESESSENGSEDPGNLKLPLLPPRPPVITVSEELKEEEKEEEEKSTNKGVAEERSALNSVSGPQYAPITNKEELTSIPKLPITQPVDEEDEEEEAEEEEEEEWQEMDKVRNSHPHGGDDTSTNGDINQYLQTTRDRDFFKMTLTMAMTFVLCTLPLLVVEAVKDSMHVHTYVNVGTCLRALSSIQTIVFPQLVLCMDQGVKQALSRVKVGLCQGCAGRSCHCLLPCSGRPHGASAAATQV